MDLNSLGQIRILHKYIELVNRHTRINGNLINSVKLPLICVDTSTVMKIRPLFYNGKDPKWTQVKYKYLSPTYGKMCVKMFEKVRAGGTTTCRKTVLLSTRVWNVEWKGTQEWPSRTYIENICLGYHVERYNFINSLKRLKTPTNWHMRHREPIVKLLNPYYIQDEYDKLKEGLKYEDIFI
jgi:hypothetical protein